MTREEFIKQRCEIDKITEEEFERTYRVVECNCGKIYCKGYRCLDLDGLSKENQELKKKYENAVADYEATMFEKEQLRKQLEEYQLQNINLREDIMIQKIAFPNKLIKDKTFYNLYDMPTYEELLAQQKEFIKYLEDEIKNIQIKWRNKLIETGYIDIAMTVGAYQIILQKYKEIIGDDK